MSIPFLLLFQQPVRELRHSVVVMYDGLDEGREPTTSSTAILAGLALAAADLVDALVPVRPILFVRDNMFRALAAEDSDFTRHIEENTLRLHWDEASLLHLVAMRLRVALGLIRNTFQSQCTPPSEIEPMSFGRGSGGASCWRQGIRRGTVPARSVKQSRFRSKSRPPACSTAGIIPTA